MIRIKPLIRYIIWKLQDKASQKPHVFCVGDSHSSYFRFSKYEDKIIFKVLDRISMVPGSTAYGCLNPNSKSGARTKILNVLSKIRKDSPVVLSLGEVDCAFSIWKRAEKKGTTIEKEAMNAVENLLLFMDELKEQGFSNLIVATASPPTIEDWKNWKTNDDINHFRRKIKASLKERTDLVRLYNSILRSTLPQRDYLFLDVESDYIDPSTGLVKQDMRMDGDIHLDWDKAVEVNYNALKKLGIIDE